MLTSPTPNPTPTPDDAALSILRDLQSLTDANARDLSAQQIPVLRQLFEDRTFGLFFFAQIIFGYADLTMDLHLPICRFISRWGSSELQDGTTIWTPPNESNEELVQDSYRRLMVCIPRECFKTSLCTRANGLWQIALNPDITIGLFNEKQDNAEAWTGAVAEVVESSLLFQTIWRDIIPRGIGYWDKDNGISRPRSLKWGATGLRFERSAGGMRGVPELTLEPHGIGGATTGKHFTHKILDDIIGKEAAYSPAVMQAANDWVDNSRPLERPAEHGCELVVHTPWGYADTYAHMLKKWPDDYKVHRRHILEDPETGAPDHLNGRSIFPTKISTRKAKALLRTDFFVNMAQYQCQPRANKDQSFSDEWLRYGSVLESGDPVFRIRDDSFDPTIYDPNSEDTSPPKLVPLSWMRKGIILDPAPSKRAEVKAEPTANNGIVCVAIDPWGRRYLLDSVAVREGPTEILHIIMELCERWGATTIGIEEVNFSQLYQPHFEYVVRHEYDWTPDIIPLLTKGRDKDSRIRQNLIRVFENGYWYFNQVKSTRVVQELMEYPNGETKDLVDALSYTDELLDRPLAPDTLEDLRRRTRQEDNLMGLTGYGAFMVEPE
jgi:phage terminase large subunit-like protein